MRRVTAAVVAVVLGAAADARAGTGYRVTATADGKTVTYRVDFGGGRASERMTAFDPATKKFVYLSWPRGGPAPAAAAVIWDHRTGETVPLYKFPGAADPLPAIPSIEAMKVCPVTGDPKFKFERELIFD